MDALELAVSEQSALLPLRDWLRTQILPETEMTMDAATPRTGELGSLDVLTVMAGSGGLMAAIRTLPDFIRSRRTGFRIETTVRGQPFVLDATNVEAVLPILERLLDEPSDD